MRSRVLWTIPTLFVVVTLTFVLMRSIGVLPSLTLARSSLRTCSSISRRRRSIHRVRESLAPG